MTIDGAASASPSRLLHWFDRKKRPLSWREDRDPYRVLVSEVMLQQTRAATVERYFRRFVEAFPRVQDLAVAAEPEVLALWSGLGYYSRARRLHQAAREIVARGQFPTSAEELQELPGIGCYTAAAVASIAFGECTPVIDGNVERVISRLLRRSGDPKRVAVRRQLLEHAASWLSSERPGDSNQALMELGATLCTPRDPRCGHCPIARFCRAAEVGDPESFPQPRVRRARERHGLLVALIQEQGRVLLSRRPRNAPYLANLWMLPAIEIEPRSATETKKTRSRSRPPGKVERRTLLRLERRLESLRDVPESAGGFELEPESFRLRHSITYRDFEVLVVRGRRRPERESARTVPKALRSPGWFVELGWFDRAGIARLPTSSLVHKVLAGSAKKS